MKKYVLFSYDYPPLEGGISRLCVAIVEALKEQGKPVEVLTLKRTLDAGFSAPDVPEFRVPFKRGKRELLSWQWLRKLDSDTVVITDVWHPEALLCKLAGIRNLVVLAHGNDVMKGEPTIKNRVLTALRKRVLESATLVICNSQYTEGVVKQTAPKTNTVAIPLGVDEKLFKPASDKMPLRHELNLPQDKKLVLTTSRVNAYKAHDIVIKALAELPEKVRGQLQYVVAGRGDYLPELKKLASHLGVEESITWLGFVPDELLPKLYQAVDLFALCTREEKAQKAVEGFGLVFLEAQASGIPVIGSNQGGIPDAVKQGNGGWLIERDDHKQLASHLSSLISDPESFLVEGQKARLRVEKEATWQHYGKKVADVLNGI